MQLLQHLGQAVSMLMDVLVSMESCDLYSIMLVHNLACLVLHSLTQKVGAQNRYVWFGKLQQKDLKVKMA